MLNFRDLEQRVIKKTGWVMVISLICFQLFNMFIATKEHKALFDELELITEELVKPVTLCTEYEAETMCFTVEREKP